MIGQPPANCPNCGRVPEAGMRFGLCSSCLAQRMLDPDSDESNPAAPGFGYHPGREIARGGMGAILDTRDPKLDRSVAMKVLLRRNASEVERQRFLQEARVLGRLAHPNIVPIHDLGTDEQGRLFYTMKLVQGATLHDVLEKLEAGDKETLAKYPLIHLLAIFQKICDAVAFAHSRGIIHRDLKPQNIMVGEFGEVLVMDWGLAKVMARSTAAAPEKPALPLIKSGTSTATGVGETVVIPSIPPAGKTPDSAVPISSDLLAAPGLAPRGTQLTMEGSVMGSPHYMSPEQAEGRNTDLDARSDVFSLGGVLYAMLTLHPPVEGDTVEEILTKLRGGDITPPSSFHLEKTRAAARRAGSTAGTVNLNSAGAHLPGGQMPEALSAVVMKALAVRRKERYPTVAALAADIEAYQGGFATGAENAGALTLFHLFLRRHKILAGSAALIAALTIGFIAKVISSEKKATAHAQTAEQNEAKAKTEAERATQAEHRTKAALVKSALALAEAGLREGNGPAMQAALKDVPEDLRDATWRYLFDQSDTSIARLQSSDANSTIESVAAHPRRAGVFAMADSQNKVTLIDVQTGVRLLEFNTAFPPNTAGSAYRIAFSPDGEHIAVGRRQSGGIVIHSARDGEKIMAWDSPATTRLEFSPDGSLLLQDQPGTWKRDLWDTASGQRRWTTLFNRPSPNPIFTPDGKHLLMEAPFSVIQLNAKDGRLVRKFKEVTYVVAKLAISPDGKKVVVGGADGTLMGLDFQSGDTLFVSRASDGRFKHLGFTPDSGRFVSIVAPRDGRQTIQLWDANTGSPVRSLLGGQGAVEDGAVHPLSGELLISGSDSRAWNLIGTQPEWTSETMIGLRQAHFAFWGSDDVIFAPSRNNGTVLQKAESGNPTPLWKPTDDIIKVTVSADGRFAAILADEVNKLIAILRNPSSKPEQIAILRLSTAPTNFQLSPTGDRLAAIELAGKKLEMFDTANGTQPVTLDQRDMLEFRGVNWLHDGQRLVSLVTAKQPRGTPGSEEWIVLWDAATGKIIQTTTNFTAMDVLAVAPHGRRFAEAGADKLVRIRDAATLAVRQEFRAHDDFITALAWHPTKPILATGSLDMTIRLWNLETGRRLEELLGNTKRIHTLGFSPSGRRLGSASNNNIARIWNPPSLNDQPASK